jgi:hypothetical protein
MHRANSVEQDGNDAIVAAVTRTLDVPLDIRQPRATVGRNAPPSRFAGLVGWLRTCWRQERQRRELAAMRGRDFGDLTVPPSLVTDELRRWPWQVSSPQWGAVAAGRRGGEGEAGGKPLDIADSGPKRVARSGWILF